MQDKNFNDCKALYTNVENKFNIALEMGKDCPEYHDNTLYKGEEIAKYDSSFLSHIDPAFVQDMVKNNNWYDEHLSQFLLNINYPCKLQTDCLKEIELIQQTKND